MKEKEKKKGVWLDGGGGGGKKKREKRKENLDTYASIKKAAQPPCKLPSGLSMSKYNRSRERIFKQTTFVWVILKDYSDGPSVTVTSHTTLASDLVDSSALGTIDASTMERRSPMDAPYTFGRDMTSCMILSSICLVLSGRLPSMRVSAPSGEEEFILLSKGRAIKDRGVWCRW